jgi:alanyl-tRNA synthetase
VRRIEAVTSGDAYAYLHGKELEARELEAEIERLRKEARTKPAAKAEEFDVEVRDVRGNRVLLVQARDFSGRELKDLSDRLRQAEKAAAVLTGSVDDGRAFLVVNLDKALSENGVDAVAIVREAASVIGGGGGGRADLAEAGGRRPEHLEQALETGVKALEAALA